MRRRALRFVLGLGYVLLLTSMLLYQAGAFGGRRSWGIAALTTLVLGVALAVVLALYVRVSEQVRKEGGTPLQSGRDGVFRQDKEKADRAGDAEAFEEGKETDGSGQKPAAGKAVPKCAVQNRSYEEIYADFLSACEGRGLSERELEVAWLLYRGRTNRQIGEELFIAETTVKKHVTHIYQKLEVYSRKDFRAMVQNGASADKNLGEKE